jgi:hypothetical protein
VANKFDLIKDIEFSRDVKAAIYDESSRTWEITLGNGRKHRSRFLIAGIGGRKKKTKKKRKKQREQKRKRTSKKKQKTKNTKKKFQKKKEKKLIKKKQQYLNWKMKLKV